MSARVLLIDNYDSFTYNLYQFISELGHKVEVIRNDAITVDEVAAKRPDCIVLSPGPGRPEDAGVCVDVIHRYAGEIPILGVCLGHQAIAHAYGGDIVGAAELRHGKTSPVRYSESPIYADLPNPFNAIRYHSLCAKPETLPSVLVADAWAPDGTIMGLHHERLPLYGVQFHPESILTEGGKTLLGNFIATAMAAQPVAVGVR